MHVSIVGSGYVGLVTGAGLSESGHHVLCMDIDEARIESLNAGRVPIHEPGLDDMIRHNAAEGRLRFTTSIEAAVAHARIVLIAVGTPPSEDGSADLNHILEVARNLGRVLQAATLIVVKSTVPVGTCARVRETLQAELDRRAVDLKFDVASNPEFLAEGVAVQNFLRPDRIIIGVDSERAEHQLRALYAPFNRHHEKIITMDIRSSELTKYAANAMLATKISLMNELSNIAEAVGADIELVRRGIGSDPRIGYSFIYPGPGFGGSCFPKDIRALSTIARTVDIDPRMLAAVEETNERQKEKLFELLQRHFGASLDGLSIAVWGLAFKPDTDDMREAPSRVLIDRLLHRGVRVRAHDPQAMDQARKLWPDQPQISFHDDPYEAARDADALALVTEWKQYWAPEMEILAQVMRGRVLFDGRNIWLREEIRHWGFTCYSIGRPPISPTPPA